MSVCGPSPRTTAWIESATGDAVVGSARLPGATSSRILRIELSTGSRLVLREYGAEYLHSEPIAPLRELDALDRVASTAVNAPVAIAADVDGSATGAPRLLMTEIAGRPGPQPAPWTARAAAALAAIHDTDPTGHRYHYFTYFRTGAEPSPPPWAEDAALWESAIETAAAERQAEDRFIHRDFHPGNLLWDRTAIGVVDWPAGCVGPAAVDLAHFRLNLHIAGRDDLESAFVDVYRAEGGAGPDPWWDLVAALDVLPWDQGPRAIAAWAGLPGVAGTLGRSGIERFIRRARTDL